MSNLALMEVQYALYTKLSGDSVLMDMVAGVYDVVPQNTAPPYIVLGDGNSALQPAAGMAVTECRLALQVWTEGGGRKKALTIMNRIHALLHLGTLSLSGFTQVVLRVERAATELAEQGTRIRATMVIQVMVAEA